MSTKIIVVGSSNTDMVMKTTRFPKPGETLMGGEFFVFQGGKGANQAVAAARAGGQVHFVCKVGNDPLGVNAIEHYKSENIETSGILIDERTATGTAVITVNDEGENCIIVAPGANAMLTQGEVSGALENHRDADWIITQLETPIEVINYLAKYATQNKKKLVLNPAPAAALPDEVYQGLFLITPNETETEMLSGIAVVDEKTALEAAAFFKLKGVQNTIITMGSKGAFVSTESFTGMIATQKVNVVDTTAAGDVFNGSLLVALSEDKSWKASVEFACRAAAISVTKMGAQASAPLRAEIDE